ncbi:MAG: UDP-3-O-(3-hydroxymyristoyl)glucosamine N-acyltransferase [Planctomycetes bacterium]|nr:UDP-3-O-(3-hydroxymyristoyl)glucosamine N-acyltransferase [Planctomycetota bacterium]
MKKLIDLTVSEIAAKVGGKVLGDGTLRILGVATLDSAGPQDISFFHNPKYVQSFRDSKAGCVLIREDSIDHSRTFIVCDDPYLAFGTLLQGIWRESLPKPGVSERAIIADSAKVAEGVCIRENAVIGERTTIEKGAIVYPGVVIGDDCEIGPDTILYANVSIYSGCKVGARVIVHSGSVIGADGFGFATVGGKHHKIPQLGGVIVEDDVEIGACVTIDRGTLESTRIGRGTKIDNHVQVGHNVQTGENCLFVSQSGISGSAKLGNNVILGGQAGVAGHVTIGDRVMVSGQGGATKSFPADSVVGHLGIPHAEYMRVLALSRKLPEMQKRIKELEAAVAGLRANEN